MFNFFKKTKQVVSEPVMNVIVSPVTGEVVNITKTNDEMFASECLGKGAGIIASDNTLKAPVDGKIVTLFPTLHAVGIRADNGAEILIHVGIDTVELNGRHFSTIRKQGDQVKAGEEILQADFASIKKAGYDPIVMVIVTNSSKYPNIVVNEGLLNCGEELITF